MVEVSTPARKSRCRAVHGVRAAPRHSSVRFFSHSVVPYCATIHEREIVDEKQKERKKTLRQLVSKQNRCAGRSTQGAPFTGPGWCSMWPNALRLYLSSWWPNALRHGEKTCGRPPRGTPRLSASTVACKTSLMMHEMRLEASSFRIRDMFCTQHRRRKTHLKPQFLNKGVRCYGLPCLPRSAHCD